MKLGEARLPEGLRIYAIGDVHGCDDLLARMHDEIAADLETAPSPDHRIVHLGDLVDRGPDSAGVVERVSRLAREDGRVLAIRGNHEEMLLAFLRDPVGMGRRWIANSGDSTLANYGVEAASAIGGTAMLPPISENFARKLPVPHRAFLEALPYWYRFGDFIFSHAGIRPGVPMEEQDPHDLVWIREGFLDSDDDFGAVVVHGHTPARRTEVLPNRINIDTGIIIWGKLTCAVIEGSEVRFLQVER